MPTLFSILSRAARHTSAARDAAASRSARSAAASRSAPLAAASASRASIAVRQALMYPEEEEEDDEEEEEEEDEEEEEHESRSRGRSLPAFAIDDPVPGKDVTEKDLESDEAIWALYERWCKAYNKERDHDEMARRFNRFKTVATFLYDCNKAYYPERQAYLGKFADGVNAQEFVELERMAAALFKDPKCCKEFLEERKKVMFIESPNQSP